MSYKNYDFMDIDKAYYLELRKEADLYRQIIKQHDYLLQQIALLKHENHSLRHQIEELEKQDKLQQ